MTHLLSGVRIAVWLSVFALLSNWSVASRHVAQSYAPVSLTVPLPTSAIDTPRVGNRKEYEALLKRKEALQPAPTGRSYGGLSFMAFVFSLTVWLSPLGLLFGLLALRKINRSDNKKARPVAMVAVIVSGIFVALGLFVLGIVLAQGCFICH